MNKKAKFALSILLVISVTSIGSLAVIGLLDYVTYSISEKHIGRITDMYWLESVDGWTYSIKLNNPPPNITSFTILYNFNEGGGYYHRPYQVGDVVSFAMTWGDMMGIPTTHITHVKLVWERQN